jgi:aldose 1-epimerase
MNTARYSAEQIEDRGVSLLRLVDSSADLELLVAPHLGNRAVALRVRGANILHFPFENVAAAVGQRGLNGIPFLAPWGNRMGGGGFGANGRWFPFPGGENLLRMDANGLPIHGLLTASSLWEVAGTRANETGAECVSRLEFWRYPEMMANWPFAHEYEMTYRLAAGALEVRVAIRNLSASAMPVAVGFHPYFVLPGVKRVDAVAHLPVRLHVETDSRLVATGEFTAANLPDSISLAERKLDDGFTDLVRDAAGNATFSVEGGGKRIEVSFGPKYTVAIIYAPPGEDFLCFEPMAALTNGVNLAYEGKYSGLQTVPPGGVWAESFHVRASGF